MALICQGVPTGIGGCPQDRRRILLDLVWLMASAVCCFESCIWPNDHRYRGRISSLEDGGVSGLAFAQLEPRAGSPAVQVSPATIMGPPFRHEHGTTSPPTGAVDRDAAGPARRCQPVGLARVRGASLTSVLDPARGFCRLRYDSPSTTSS